MAEIDGIGLAGQPSVKISVNAKGDEAFEVKGYLGREPDPLTGYTVDDLEEVAKQVRVVTDKLKAGTL